MKVNYSWIKRIRFRKKLKDSSFPNKCDTCVFIIQYDRSKAEINEMFDELLKLKSYDLSFLPSRVMEIGNIKKLIVESSVL